MPTRDLTKISVEKKHISGIGAWCSMDHFLMTNNLKRLVVGIFYETDLRYLMYIFTEIEICIPETLCFKLYLAY